MSASKPTPAWREPMVWLVAGGPAAVVVASFITLALALRHPDPPLQLRMTAAPAADDAGPAGPRAGAGDPVPAVLARNHAATGAAGVTR